MSASPKILALNPGSTSTKFAVYQGKDLLFQETVRHPDRELLQFANVSSQLEYRLEQILRRLEEKGVQLHELAAVAGRGGFLSPIPSGTYRVNEKMLDDLQQARYGEHASNLGAIMAYRLAEPHRIPAFIVDPVAVDEMEDAARFSGISDLERKSHFHALNIKAVSRKVAEALGQSYNTFNFVVAHIGGGISVVAERKGRVIDVNNAMNEGPFSPERAGGLPSYQLAQLCYSGKYTEKEMLNKLTREGGLYSYLGSKDVMEIEGWIQQGDDRAKSVLDGMIYQIAKEIGAMAAAMDGEVDRIILTGGISHSKYIVDRLARKVAFIAPIEVVPGEEELEALAFGALRVVLGAEAEKEY
jgi:butyrate kinase